MVVNLDLLEPDGACERVSWVKLQRSSVVKKQRIEIDCMGRSYKSCLLLLSFLRPLV